MVTVKIIGGLGNQMFQYAYAKMLEHKGYNVKIDISAFESYKLHGGYQLNKYNIDLEIIVLKKHDKFSKHKVLSKIVKRIGFYFIKQVKEKSLLFDSKLLEVEDGSSIEGYFQSEKYFENIRTILIKQFTVNQKLSNYTKKIKDDINNAKYSCSVHIRRGDFTSHNNINIHGVCDETYYKKSIELMNLKGDNIQYFIFSDDIKWAKENLNIENVVYVESKENRLPHEDIYLMSLCTHNIIANSSFSWWGAWLNNNKEKIVIAPKNWFANQKMQEETQNIFCENWIRI